MNDLNLCQFIGRLGKKPELRYQPSGKAVVNLSLAVGSKWKDQQGQNQERVEWVRVSAFGKLAEIIGSYLDSGSQVYVSGRLRTNKWQDNNGQDRYTTEIVADNMQMLGGGNQQSGQQQNQQRPANQNQPPMQEPDFSFDDDVSFAPIGLQYPALLNCM